MPDSTDKTNPESSDPGGKPVWTEPFDWPFGTPPPTRDYLSSQGLDPDHMHLLGLNEAPLPPGATVQEAVARAAHVLNRYPDNVLTPLVEAVAKRTGTAAGLQIWGSGAGELIHRAVAIAARERLHIVSPSPTFWGYERIYALFDADVTRTPLQPDGRMDVAAFLAAITPRTGLVTFVTPGNPSGTSLSEEEIETIARRTPDNALLMVDEVYHEFSAFEGGPDALDILRRTRRAPWVVLRSFSKAYRLAGARVGYGLASDQATARRLREHSLNFTVSSLGFAAALAAYEDRQALSAYLAFNRDRKPDIYAQLRQAGAAPLESSANFISARLPVPAAGVLARLREAGIICAGWNHGDFPDMIRIGIGHPESNAAVASVLRDLRVESGARRPEDL